jgi:hypothetical protein
MAISQVATQVGKAVGDNTTGVQRAFGSNVSLGSLITIVAGKWATTGSTDAFIAADCIKQAGTATIDTPTLDIQFEVTDGGDRYSIAVYSCLVTGAGSLTMRVQGAVAGSYLFLFTDEWSGTWDASRIDGTPAATGTATNSQTSASSGDTTSTAAALFIAGLCSNAGNSGYSMTALNSFTKAAEETDGSAHWVGAYGHRVVGSGSTLPSAWTIGSANQGWAAGIVAYKEATGGGTPTEQPYAKRLGGIPGMGLKGIW